MTEYSELLSLIRRSWRHSVYAWKGVISTWPTAPFDLEFSRVSGRATLLEYPRKSRRYLPITESFPQVVLYDDTDMCFIEPARVKPSDLDIMMLEQLSFAAWVSQLLGLGRQKPVEQAQGLFRLPAAGYKVFLGLDASAVGCLSHIRQVLKSGGEGCLLITICPCTNVSTVKAAARDIQLFPLDSLIQANETGIAEKVDLYEIVGNQARAMTKGRLNWQLPGDAAWEDIRMEISTLDTNDVRHPDMLQDKVRFSFVRNNIVLHQTAPKYVRDLHPRLHTGTTVTALWLLMRDYARHQGTRDANRTEKKRAVDNTHRSALAKVLKELVGLTEPPFRPTRPSRTRFTVFFNNF